MDATLPGIHHVTAIVGDAQRNLDFYSDTLGLRLVKLTVNFDDPGTYHLYFGDAAGQPGTIITFFPWGGAAPRGRRGSGQVTATAFSMAEGALGYWRERLAARGVETRAAPERFGEQVLAFDDPDGLELELIAHPGADARPGQAQGDIPHASAIRGLHSVTLSVAAHAPSAALLAGALGFRETGADGARRRYATGAGTAGALVDLLATPLLRAGSFGAGTVHHVAWRTPDDRQALAWRELLAGAGMHVTPIKDRDYFRSIYFREPGGVIYEIATDTPGFATDESPDQLGSGLRLPAQYEQQRARIEQLVPPLRLPYAKERSQ